MMQLLAQLLGQQDSGNYICTVSGAGTSGVNGNYNATGGSIMLAVKTTNDYSIQHIMDYPTPGHDSYVLLEGTTPGAGGGLYWWNNSEGFNPTTINKTGLASNPVPTIQ